MADEENSPESPEPGAPSDHHMLADLWHDHKTPIMIVIAAATMLLTAILVFRHQSSTGSSTAAPGTPTASGVPTAQTSSSTNAYDSLSGYMQAILQQLQQLQTPGASSGSVSGSGSGSGTSSPPPRPPSRIPVPPHPPRPGRPIPVDPPLSQLPQLPPQVVPQIPQVPQRQFVTVGQWTPNPAWNTTLSGIAQHEGTTLTRIEALNPQISNPNLIYPNQQVRIA